MARHVMAIAHPAAHRRPRNADHRHAGRLALQANADKIRFFANENDFLITNEDVT
jgi:hypothetical protein